jgi:hypothetical protein
MMRACGSGRRPAAGSVLVGGGIGRAVTAACVATGLRVAVLNLPRSLERHPPPEGVVALPLDATDERMVDDAFRWVYRPRFRDAGLKPTRPAPRVEADRF